MRWCAVMPSLPTWKVVSVPELASLIDSPICPSVRSLIARICPWMVSFARLSLAGLSSWSLSVGMCALFVLDVDDAGLLVAL